MRRRTVIPFDVQCRAVGVPPPVAEYRFHPVRKWRIDWAWPERKVALEVEGGVFLNGGGRHTRGAGFMKDTEKYNTLAAMGWRLFRVVPKQIANGEALRTIEAVFGDGPAALQE